MIYQSCFNDTNFSRYSDSLSARGHGDGTAAGGRPRRSSRTSWSWRWHCGGRRIRCWLSGGVVAHLCLGLLFINLLAHFAIPGAVMFWDQIYFVERCLDLSVMLLHQSYFFTLVLFCLFLKINQMRWNDLRWSWGHDEGSLVASFRFRVSSLPVTWCLRMLRMVFIQNRRLSNFSHWLIMETSQNWHNLRSPISKFRDTSFIDTITAINHWKYQGGHSVGVAMTSIQTLLGEVTKETVHLPNMRFYLR